MDVTYGVTEEDAQDPFVQTAQHVMDVVAVGLSPPLWLLNPLARMQLGIRRFTFSQFDGSDT